MSTYNYNPYMGGTQGFATNPGYNMNYTSGNYGFNGRIVENFDSAKVADVPLGSYGIFPKSDMSEIYIKSWNANGTTNMLTYKLVEGQPDTQQFNNVDLSPIVDELKRLSAKIESLIGKKDVASGY